MERTMILNDKRAFIGSILFAIALMAAGCSNPTVILPEKGPEVVAKQFYEYISEAKLRGPTPAKEAFKLIDSKTANMDEQRFLSIIKLYPPGFMAEIGKAEINGTQAVVAITFKMPSTFGGSYDVKGSIPLNLDKDTNSWIIDFTGDTYGMSKEEFMANKSETSQ